jgi:hypothetical protein
MTVKVEKANQFWAPTAKWVCRGPEVFDKPAGERHLIVGPEKPESYCKDESGYLDWFCHSCTVTYGLLGF